MTVHLLFGNYGGGCDGRLLLRDRSLETVVHATSALIADGLFHFLVASNVNWQLSSVGPRIQVRAIAHEQHRDLQMTFVSSNVEGSIAIDIGPVPVQYLL